MAERKGQPRTHQDQVLHIKEAYLPQRDKGQGTRDKDRRQRTRKKRKRKKGEGAGILP